MTSASRRGSRLRRSIGLAALMGAVAFAAVAQDPASPLAQDVPTTANPVPPSEGAASPRVVSSAILTLNQDAVFTGSALGQRVISELERDRNALAAENRRIEAELSAEEQALTEQRAILPAAEFAQLARVFDEKVQSLRESQDRKSRLLQERLDAERRTFTSQAGPVLADIARERGALAILDKTVVLMSFDVIDITDEVVRRLDAAIGDGRSELGGPFSNQTTPDLRPVPRLNTEFGTGLSGTGLSGTGTATESE